MSPARDARGRFVSGNRSASLEWDDEELRRELPEIAALLFRNMHAALTTIGERHEQALNRLHRATPPRDGLIPRKPPNSPLSTITRSLLDSQVTTVSPPRSSGGQHALNQLRLMRTIGGLSAPHARPQEFGAIIRPVTRKVLTIPTRFQRTQAGDARGRAIHEDGHWRRVKGNKLFFFDNETGLPLFKGVGPGLDQEEVEIPPRLRFIKTFREQMPGNRRVLNLAVKRAVQRKPLAPGAAS